MIKKAERVRLRGAKNGIRTRDLHLGKVALYQLSYFRNYMNIALCVKAVANLKLLKQHQSVFSKKYNKILFNLIYINCDYIFH